MASVKYEKNEEITMQLSFEEKASLDEIIKHAECSMESQELWDQSIDVLAENECLDKVTVRAAKIRIRMLGATLWNQTKGPLIVMNSKKFAGHVVKNFPSPLEGTGALLISAMTDKGVKAGVVYSGKNNVGVECGWLLAFGDTNATGRRIYAECGRKDKFKNIKWAQVEKNLDKAGGITKVYDEETQTSLYAKIAGTSGKSIVGAAFLG